MSPLPLTMQRSPAPADVRSLALVAPGDLGTRTGGYIYDRRIVDGLRALGWRVTVSSNLENVPDGGTALVDGLTWLSASVDLERHQHRIRLVPLVHLPLGLEVGIDPGEAAHREAVEERALVIAPLVIATGAVTVDYLSARGIAPERIALVEPGTDAAPVARGSGGDVVQLVCVAALTPGKGHAALVRSLAAVPSRRWRLTCVGSCDRDRATTAHVQASIEQLGLSRCVTLAGELDAEPLAELYDRSDAFALATLRETFGMAVAEAIARGLPVVATRVGAIAQIVGHGGLLVPPDDERALTGALTRLIDDRERRALAEGARAARTRLRTWEETSKVMAAALARVSADD